MTRGRTGCWKFFLVFFQAKHKCCPVSTKSPPRRQPVSCLFAQVSLLLQVLPRCSKVDLTKRKYPTSLYHAFLPHGNGSIHPVKRDPKPTYTMIELEKRVLFLFLKENSLLCD
ncbi:hypothetical protein AVEN_102523-1 [Araneus ventricosus]|uniref:Uncharacterized protein n=1 Tax=Araneus ventricosus TaxID=182803 RepID=A0A4Y2BKP5_ARAVE|nr:hypothetical protein AVEN_102523-1 [Araneus ventricosus]